jgi:protein-disulfide isomerase
VPLLEQVLEKNPDTVNVVFKNFPIRSHKFAAKAAMAALAAGEEGKFWEFHDMLFQNYNRLNDQKIDEIAVSLGLDQAKFAERKNAPEFREQIRKDSMQARMVGVRGTPTIFVNGRKLRNRSLEGFQTLIDQELQKAAKPKS